MPVHNRRKRMHHQLLPDSHPKHLNPSKPLNFSNLEFYKQLHGKSRPFYPNRAKSPTATSPHKLSPTSQAAVAAGNQATPPK